MASTSATTIAKVRDGPRRHAHIGIGEVVGNDAAPSVRPELYRCFRLRHLFLRFARASFAAGAARVSASREGTVAMQSSDQIVAAALLQLRNHLAHVLRPLASGNQQRVRGLDHY